MLGHQFSTKHKRVSPISVVDTVTILGLYVMSFQRLIKFLTRCSTKQLNMMDNVQNSTEVYFKVLLSKYFKVATYTVQKIMS